MESHRRAWGVFYLGESDKNKQVKVETPADEENNLLELMEDKRLIRQGIDPKLPYGKINLELTKRQAQIEAEKAQRKPQKRKVAKGIDDRDSFDSKALRSRWCPSQPLPSREHRLASKFGCLDRKLPEIGAGE